MSKTGEQNWQAYLSGAMQAAGIDSGAELARRAGINESQVSRWLRGIGQPDLTNLRRIAPVLGRPVLELAVAAGHLSPEEAKLKEVRPPEPQPVDVLEAIRRDPDLLPEAREHLLNQYGLLLRIGGARETKPADVLHLPRVARKRPGPKRQT